MSDQLSCDYLIIGQGLAGTVLAHTLLSKGKSIFILDEYRDSTSSRVAAGLFHPVTGRRIVKSWMVDELFSFANNFYPGLEKLLESKFFFPGNLIEIISSAHEYNVWSERLDDPGIARYLATDVRREIYDDKLIRFLKLIALSGAGWMDIAKYLDVSLKAFSKAGLLHSGKFSGQDLEVCETGFNYKHIRADKIIFCEGSDALQNPLWSWIPFLQSKGEILTIQANTLPEEYILMKGLFLIPLGKNRFRVGSTYSWKFTDELPTESAKLELVSKLKEIIAVPFEIVEHKAAIRPTTKDRRPLIGEHPLRKNLFIFNGLGTKGVLLAPYFANEFANYLISGKELNQEVRIERFYSAFNSASSLLSKGG